MVGMHVNLLWSSKEIDPLLECEHDSQQILFLDTISSFC